MNNRSVEAELNSCRLELSNIQTLINSLGATSQPVPYLTKFSLILACGAIERSFKTLLSDFCCHRSKQQVKNFINTRVRRGSANPSWDNMTKFLREFDPTWHASLKTNIAAKPRGSTLKTSIKSLVDARNDFAHGGSPTTSIGDVVAYFDDSREIIEEIDSIIG